jgi:2-methylcitrate dehydratase PrpD
VANALLRGDTGMQAFTDEKVNDPEVRGLMKRIEVLPDSNLQGMAAKVEVETHSGQIFQGSNDILNEIPELEIKKEKVRAKFMDLCAPALGRKTSEDTMGSVLALEDFKNMKTFIERIHHS